MYNFTYYVRFFYIHLILLVDIIKQNLYSQHPFKHTYKVSSALI